MEREFDSLSAIPRGAQALAWLSEKIDAFGGQEQSAQEEVEFIDGSAAFLAAVLVDHMEKAQHVEHEGKHRLLLGNKGFFNPFQAIEAALDAPSARPVLVEQVALAEAEAKELKGYGRLARLLDQALAHFLPDAAVINRFESKAWIHSPSWESPIELNLGRLYPLSLEEPNDALLARAIESLIRSIGTPQPAISRLEALSRIYPRIVKEDFEMSGTLFTQPWFSRLLLCLVLDYGSRFRFVRNDELHAWELSPDEAISAALSNLADR
ncbi:MAG: hypothetical protein N2515_09850, partial [Deltaproteobacteria bacterium]|nr:hypothetical protein [Deltaproteobacteria bacterium]